MGKRLLAEKMMKINPRTFIPLFAALLVATTLFAQSNRAIGTAKSIAGNTIVVTTDGGTDVTAKVAPGASVVRVAPGQKDLSAATPIALADITKGDRVLLRGTSDANGVLSATSVVVIKSEDVAAKQKRETEAWERHGIAGVVRSVDAPAGTITVLPNEVGATTPPTIRTTSTTVVRRYATSIRFSDAVRSTIGDIREGDQLRARGARTGDTFAAEEIVTGTFRNIAGTITSIDAMTSTLMLTDLATKQSVSVRITPEAQMRKLPEIAAQRIAMRLRGTPGAGTARPEGAQAPNGTAPSQTQGAPGAATGPHDGAPRNLELQNMLNRIPPLTLSELKKGDAVLVVAFAAADQLSAVNLLAGVEPILTAAPAGNRAAMLLSPWNLSGGGDAAGE